MSGATTLNSTLNSLLTLDIIICVCSVKKKEKKEKKKTVPLARRERASFTRCLGVSVFRVIPFIGVVRPPNGSWPPNRATRPQADRVL